MIPTKIIELTVGQCWLNKSCSTYRDDFLFLSLP